MSFDGHEFTLCDSGNYEKYISLIGNQDVQ